MINNILKWIKEYPVFLSPIIMIIIVLCALVINNSDHIYDYFGSFGPQKVFQIDSKLTETNERQQKLLIEGYRLYLQSMGGIVIVFGVYLTFRRIKALERQVNTIEKGHFTDRFTKAVEQLGSDKDAIILGGIYALDKLARDNPKVYHATVYEVLCAYIRDNSKKESRGEIITTYFVRNKEQISGKVSITIQAILNIVGTREIANDENYHVDLSNTSLISSNLEGANLQNANLEGANLQNANLEGANLQNANLSNVRVNKKTIIDSAILRGATLSKKLLRLALAEGISLNEVSFEKTTLKNIDLNGQTLKYVNFKEANLEEAKLQGMHFIQVDFEGASLKKADLEGVNFEGVEFKNVNLMEANITNTNLSFLQLQYVKSLYETKGIPPKIEERLRKEKPELFKRSPSEKN